MMDAGIDVKIDLIIGLPGDTVDSVRRGFDYLSQSGLYTRIQVFNLAILPGTAFRQEAERLGLKYQGRTPYYVLETPTLTLEAMCGLMEEAEEVFETEFDPLPPPVLIGREGRGARLPDESAATLQRFASLELDLPGDDPFDGLASPERRAQAYTLWLRSADFDSKSAVAANVVGRVLTDNPHTTLQVILDPAGEPSRLTARTLESLFAEFYRSTSYLDRFYGLAPGPPKGAKRLVIVLSEVERDSVSGEWFEEAEMYASIACAGAEACLDPK
jgi:hypothetical protein